MKFIDEYTLNNLPENDIKTLISQDVLRMFFPDVLFKKVLIVEDDAVQYQAIEEIIVEINPDIEIDWADNVNDAIRQINRSHIKNFGSTYDLVICDTCLPKGESGIDIYKHCHQLEPKIECLLVSTSSSNKIKSNHFDVLDYIRKPIDFNLIYRNITHNLAIYKKDMI